MSWKVIEEIERKYADNSYYLNAERECPEGMLVLKVNWCEGFMYAITVNLIKKDNGRIFWFKKVAKPKLLYGCFVMHTDRVEKYGHQIMRITENSPLLKLERMHSFQKDLVLNYRLSDHYNMDFLTTLPTKYKWWN